MPRQPDIVAGIALSLLRFLRPPPRISSTELRTREFTGPIPLSLPLVPPLPSLYQHRDMLTLPSEQVRGRGRRSQQVASAFLWRAAPSSRARGNPLNLPNSSPAGGTATNKRHRRSDLKRCLTTKVEADASLCMRRGALLLLLH